MILIIIIIIVLTILFYIAEKSLQIVVKPNCFSLEEEREYEIKNGFRKEVEAYENDWQKSDFTIRCDGADIKGEVINNPNAIDNRVAIICHGHTANRYACVKYGYMFYNLGFNVVIYDERHFGLSTGDYSTLGEKESEDLIKVYEYTKEVFGDYKLALHGESMGGATVLLSLRKLKPELVIADCAFCDSERLFREFINANLKIPATIILPFVKLIGLIRYNYHIKDTSPIKMVENSDVPICYIHGEEDSLINCDHSKQMYKVTSNPKSKLYLFPKTNHASSVINDPERYRDIVEEMVKDCF